MHNRERGQQAEEVAEWYFRLNGFLLIPGFIVHADSLKAKRNNDGSMRLTARTEADFMGVRFPHSREILNKRTMRDADGLLI
ncbi:MAG: hypothetical protein PHG00_15770 [Methylococcales bacterium]|nr:hypothetical protein [Methylococcales bacterium]